MCGFKRRHYHRSPTLLRCQRRDVLRAGMRITFLYLPAKRSRWAAMEKSRSGSAPDTRGKKLARQRRCDTVICHSSHNRGSLTMHALLCVCLLNAHPV